MIALLDAEGGLNAVVQLEDAATGTAIVSTRYFDQVYAIVAEDQTNTQFHYSAGVHLDHGFTQVTLSTNQIGLGGGLVVSGSGFGATNDGQDGEALSTSYVTGTVQCTPLSPSPYTTIPTCGSGAASAVSAEKTLVALYFVPLNGGTVAGIPTNTSPFGTSTTGGPGTYFSTTNGSFLLTAVTTDSNGAFTSSASLNGSALIALGSTPGFILAQFANGPAAEPGTGLSTEFTATGIADTFSAAGYTTVFPAPTGGDTNVRLNEGATAAVSFNISTTGGNLLISPQPASATAW